MYNFFLTYAPVPSYIIMVMAVIVLVLWTLGTDLYDFLEETFFDTDDSVGTCILHVVLSVIFTIPFVLWGAEAPPVAFFYAIWTGWLCLVVLVVSVIIFLSILSCIRDWCLSKRGKK